MKLSSQSFEDGERIPAKFAFARAHPKTHFTFAGNRSPHLAWEAVPTGTRSFALICVDPDAPSVGEDVNQEGRTVAHDLVRADFHHWCMADLPAYLRELAAGACGEGVTPKGKVDPPGPAGSRQGRNDFTGWFSGDPELAGTYSGYDGPAPPWNDEREHRYHFQLFALDVERLDLPGDFDAPVLRKAMAGHVLAEAQLTGTYTQNPELL